MIEAAQMVAGGAQDAQVAYGVQDAEVAVTGAQDAQVVPY